jgi:cysteine synthase A
MRTGCKIGDHRIQGISDEFVPSIIDLNETDEIVDAWDGDAILMSQMLAGRLGLSVGISSGANFLGAAQIVESMGADATVVTLFPDSNKKYLSTDLHHAERVRAGYLTPRIELERFRAIRR